MWNWGGSPCKETFFNCWWWPVLISKLPNIILSCVILLNQTTVLSKNKKVCKEVKQLGLPFVSFVILHTCIWSFFPTILQPLWLDEVLSLELVCWGLVHCVTMALVFLRTLVQLKGLRKFKVLFFLYIYEVYLYSLFPPPHLKRKSGTWGNLHLPWFYPQFASTLDAIYFSKILNFMEQLRYINIKITSKFSELSLKLNHRPFTGIVQRFYV